MSDKESPLAITIDVLQRELERTQAKAAATDSAFMSYLSIGVTPFLIFTAYAIAERRYQIFLAALPVLTVLGMSVVVVLSTHYSYAGAYSQYLEKRINTLLGCREIRDSHFAWLAYKQRKSPVIVSYVIALVALAALNLLAVPAINEFLRRFPVERSNAPVVLKMLAPWYWFGVVPFAAAATFCMVRSARLVWRDLMDAAEVLGAPDEEARRPQGSDPPDEVCE